VKYEIAWMCGHGTEVVAEAPDVDEAMQEAERLLRLDGCLGVIVRVRNWRDQMMMIRREPVTVSGDVTASPKTDRRHHGDPWSPQVLRDIALHPDPRD
jgi:hypothetical protein